MSFHLTGNPVIGILILLTLLYVLFRVNDIDISKFFTSEGFTKVYNENPLVVVVTVGVIVYVSYKLYNAICWNIENLTGAKIHNENFGGIDRFNQPQFDLNKEFMSFDKFYQTYVMVKEDEPESESEFEREIESKHRHKSHECDSTFKKYTYTLPQNRFMIFRTDIDGIKYYLVMESLLEQFLPYRQKSQLQSMTDADKPAICRESLVSSSYILPVLMREDLLDADYRKYLDNAIGAVAKEVDTQKALEIVKKVDPTILSSTTTSLTPGVPPTVATSTAIPKTNEHFGDLNGMFNNVTNYVKSGGMIRKYQTPHHTNTTADAATDTFENMSSSEVESYSGSEEITLEGIHDKIITIAQEAKTQAGTQAEVFLKRTMYPRYIHHLRVVRTTPSRISPMYPSIDRPRGDNPHDGQTLHKPCYFINGVTKFQADNEIKQSGITPYTIDLTRNFSPFTPMRKSTVNETTLTNNLKTVTTITKTIELVDDRKFVCGVQADGIAPPTKYSNIYFETVTPSIDHLDQILISKGSTCVKKDPPKQALSENSPSRVSDAFTLTGKDNTNIMGLDPIVNMYVLGDFKNSNNVLTKNVKCWLARLDAYTDPSVKDGTGVVSSDPTSDPKSLYYKKPKMYPIGIIPDDYKQCSTDANGSINSACIGAMYMNDVDYSDARKIDFEVITVELSPF
jgi:hypothetical protein